MAEIASRHLVPLALQAQEVVAAEAPVLAVGNHCALNLKDAGTAAPRVIAVDNVSYSRN